MTTRCPFLKEMSVRYCEISEFRKPIPCDAISEGDQRCSSAAFRGCAQAAQRLKEAAKGLDACPFLHTATVQYCEAAGDSRLIPANDSFASRCNTSAHAYCELFLGCAPRESFDRRACARGAMADHASEIPTPGHLAYLPNHMWIDVRDDGGVHIGVDAFFARAFGRADALRFSSGKGLCTPSAELRLGNIDLPIAFPWKIDVTSMNRSLESDISPLFDDPYGAGWLFAHIPRAPGDNAPRKNGRDLISGDRAGAWMASEVRRMSELLDEMARRATGEGEAALAADGGVFCPAVAAQLGCSDLITMHNHFFTPHDRWRA